MNKSEDVRSCVSCVEDPYLFIIVCIILILHKPAKVSGDFVKFDSGGNGD